MEIKVKFKSKCLQYFRKYKRKMSLKVKTKLVLHMQEQEQKTLAIFSLVSNLTNTINCNKLAKHKCKTHLSRAWWLTPAIPATQEVEIGRIAIQGHPGQKVIKTPSQ
jgi:hypothetical protein